VRASVDGDGSSGSAIKEVASISHNGKVRQLSPCEAARVIAVCAAVLPASSASSGGTAAAADNTLATVRPVTAGVLVAA
jgi:hypothetical protein